MNTPLFDILIGAEDVEHVSSVTSQHIPRLDYRLITGLCQGRVQQWRPSPAYLYGSRTTRVARSFIGNFRCAISQIPSLPPGTIVYSTGETWGLPVGLVGTLQRKRNFVHGVYAHRVFSPNWLRFLHFSRSWLAVDGWVCVTAHQAQLLRTALAPTAPQIAVIPQGVDTTFFDPLLATPPDCKPYVLSIGAEMRNYDLLFASVFGLDVDVVVKATSAWMRAGRKSQTTPIPPNVKLITERLSYIELRDLYAGAELVIVPLYDTPQAAGITTILEAMAMRKCVIATRSAGLPDILVDNVTGVVTDPTPAALAGAITALRMNPQCRDSLASAGQQAVLSNTTIEHHARQVADFLLTLYGRVC